MKLLSLNVGQPQTCSYNGKEVVTSIFKSPVEGRRNVTAFNIEGDAQGDLNAHGGALKAVYSYDILITITGKRYCKEMTGVGACLARTLLQMGWQMTRCLSVIFIRSAAHT